MLDDVNRLPAPPLRPFVALLWASDSPGGGTAERVIPTGAAHIVFRVAGPPLRLLEPSASLPHALVGGPRSSFYLRDVSQPTRSLGVMLQPGATSLLLGVPADELAERHTPLEDLWGRFARQIQERLQATPAAQQLALLERLLLARLPSRRLHPAIARAFAGPLGEGRIGVLVRDSGYSHRRFIALFRAAVGMSPKRYARVLRLQRALADLSSPLSLAEVALAAGYSDQAHLTRELRELAGVSPGEYRRARPHRSHHLPEVNSVQDLRRR